MASSLHKHAGGCHCGNIRIVVEIPKAPENTALHACACSFCRSHGARTVFDAAGTLKMWAEDWTDVTRYRFATKTADYLLCRRCGSYIGAVCPTPSGPRAVVNVNTLGDRALFRAEPAIVDRSGETPEERVARRAATWMPAVLHE